MSLIDTDRMGVRLITSRHHDADASPAKDAIAGNIVIKQDDNQLQSLMSLVKHSPTSLVHQHRLEQLNASVQANRYVIDFDALAQNILAADYEL